jgi:Mor family transcriptional regulator
MGMVPEEKKDRNADLLKDYKSGMNFVDLVSKYRISSQRIYQIVKKAEIKLVLDK